jgi:hypothetical protein
LADLSITAASVLPGSNAVVATGYAGETLTAGQLVYLKASDNKWYKADADNATAENRVARGLTLNGAATGQPVAVQTGGKVTLNAVLTAAVPYFLSATAGGICPFADLATGMYSQCVGMADSTTVLQLDFGAVSAAAHA